MPTLRPIQLDEIAMLPVQVYEEVAFGCTPAQLFASFERDQDWRVWLDLDVRRTTEGPYRAGFTRTVTSGPMVLEEVFTVWNANEEMAFYVERTNNPFVRAFAEHYAVVATDTGCTFRWRIGMEMTLMGRLLAPLFRALLRRAARKGFPKLDVVAQRS